MEQVLNIVFASVNDRTAVYDANPSPRPLLLLPDRWEWISLSCTREELSLLQLRTIAPLSASLRHKSTAVPFEMTDRIHDVLPALHSPLDYRAYNGHRVAKDRIRSWLR